MATLLKGGPVAQAICEEIEKNQARLAQAGIVPTLAIVRVGEHPSDLAYERGATKRAEKVGVQVKKFLLPADVPQETLVQTLEEINGDGSIHGCLMFRPLPPHLDSVAVCQTLDPEKDVDAITVGSMGGLLARLEMGYPPCTPTACLELLRFYHIPMEGQKVAVVGKSMTVGLPTALLMMNEEATVSVCHILSRPEDTRDLCKDADIIISAAGCPGLVTRDYVRHGQIVVDVGVTLGKDGKLHGDVAFEEVEPIVEAITPVPGGVGSVTSTVLVGHVVEAAMRRLWKDQ